MKIHIIASRLHADRVLQRLAKTLAAGTGWTLSESPDPRADLNYFFPYLELQRREWTETPSAAWFTHRDVANKMKVNLWDDVAEQVDVRLTSAPMYLPELKKHGASHYVRVAVDGQFAIGPERENRRMVGLNGWVYGDGRKGEDLVAKLAKSEIGRSCRWKASGRDWPVDTKSYPWEKMPQFFQSLDLFLCASRMEGPGLPPLEALACGVPVVVPEGVGIFDELPDIHGVWRFKVGDYDSLLETFTEAVNDRRRVDRGKLRAITDPYTSANWCTDHEAVFEQFLYGGVPEVLPDWHGNAGIYVVAFGEPSRNCAVRCIHSVKAHMPDVPVALVSAEPLKVGEDVFVKYEDLDIGGRQVKLAVDRLAPEEWRYVLYLDADQEVMEPLDFIFDLLQSGWEFVICRDMHERYWLRQMQRGDNKVEYDFTVKQVGTDHVHQYNGGMFAFRRCDRTRRFYELWNEEYQKWLGRDQGALIRALYHQPLRMFMLGNQWNASVRYELPPGPVAVLHHNMEARRYGKRRDIGRLDSEKAWQEVRRWEAAYRG